MQSSGADVVACAALHAIHDVGVFQLLHHVSVLKVIHEHRLQAHGTHAHALAAADTGGILTAALLIAAEGKDRVGTLTHGNIHIVLRITHHGAAHQNLLGGLCKAAGLLDNILNGSTYGNDQVLGLGNSAAGNGDHTLDGGTALVQSAIDAVSSEGVELDIPVVLSPEEEELMKKSVENVYNITKEFLD